MKVYMDRNHCDLWQASCESCFGRKIILKEFDIEGCVMKILEEENKSEITFYIKDRNGSDKVLYVNQENWPDAYNSWLLLWEQQQTKDGSPNPSAA
ncbi:MAG: hypothetical protein OEZ02_04290 [Anaerolineae bacterium]|nr:hypothetical protein [Anaerolineae bacterium]